jgi:hypothetical protein
MVDDRVNERWPTANLRRDVEFLPQTPTELAKMEALRRVMTNPPSVTPMADNLGMQDILRMQEFQKLIQPDLYGSYAAPNAGVRGAELPPANVQPPEPQGYGGPLPEISVEQFGPQPRVNMGVTLPTSAGDFSARGEMTNPQDWRALLGFRRSF